MQNFNPEDVISQLPDDILISIISLIPTQEALTTPILSKRWRNLFRFMSAVTFWHTCKKYPCTYNSEEFINGVHNVLQRHSALIRSFDFRICLSESCARTMEKCIVSLGDLGIQKLNLRLLNYPKSILFEFPLSCHLLSLMPTLQNFKLAYGSWLPSLQTPSNSLKTLRLFSVTVFAGSLECILSNCLSLCKLSLKNCKVPSKLCFPRLINLQLKCIIIRDCRDLEEIDFYATNLTTFDLDCNKAVNLIFDYVPQLQNIYLCSNSKLVPYFCGRLAKNVPSLKTLLLEDIEDLYQDGSIGMGINMFSNLKRLELTSCTCSWNLFSVIRVLHECTRLVEFQLATMVSYYVWPKEEKELIVHSQLKVVEISGFGGSESQVAFVTYILKNAVKLQQMIISCYPSQHLGCGKWEEADYPPSNSKKWSELYECIQQMKLEAASKTLQVVAQEFPQRKSKLF